MTKAQVSPQWIKSEQCSTVIVFLNNSLDHSLALLIDEKDVVAAIKFLTDSLRVAKDNATEYQWSTELIPLARNHLISKFIYECPLTLHSLSRPRGYPGDAELLDLIYAHQSVLHRIESASEIGRAIFEVTSNVSACEAVRVRRQIVATYLDEVVAKYPEAELMSLACGHFREAELSQGLKSGRIKSLFALDQDEFSLQSVELYKKINANIFPRKISVRNILADKHDLGTHHFIYSAGLYDYLSDNIALRLTSKLFDLLKSGGTLLLANFLCDIWESSYMEAYMNWQLIYRNEAAIWRFAEEIDSEQIASLTYVVDSTGCVGYLEIVRA